jgi:Rha family phage regulatory protein
MHLVSVPVLNYREFIDADGDRLTTTSHRFAIAFNKPHKEVLKRIRLLITDLGGEHEGYFSPMLMPVDIGQGGTRMDPAYVVTRDGFSLLAMSFTGKKALAFKVAYMRAFNAMADFIKNQREGLSYRRAAHELADADSKRRASVHGRGLNERKQEIPILTAEELLLRALSQPLLPGIVPDPQAGGALPNEAEPDPKS